MHDVEQRRVALEYALRMGGDALTDAERVLQFLWPVEAVTPKRAAKSYGPHGSRWTDERKAYLAEAYPAGVSVKDMYDRLSAMDGAPINDRSITRYAVTSMNLRRANPNQNAILMVQARRAKRAAANGAAAR